MAGSSGEDLLFGELIQVQQRQPAPRDQDALRYGTPPRQQRPQAQPAQPRAQPIQAQPQLPQQAQAPEQPSDPTGEWSGLMRKHGIGSEQWGPLVDQYYRADREGQAPATGNPTLDADLSAYAKRFPGQGRQQAAPPQGAAQPQQQGSSPQPAAPPPSAQPQAPMNGMDMLFGSSPQQQAAAPASNPNAEADAPTWFGRRLQDVRGRQDPRHKELPNIAAVLRGMDGDTGTQIGGEAGSWLLGASDTDMGRTYQAMLGKRFIRQEADANGYPIIVYRDQGGKEARAYVNNPGLDGQDVLRGVYGALPFAKAGQVIGRAVQGAPLIGRMGAQAIGQAGTSVAQDAAAVGTGVSDFDPVNSGIKAGIAGAGGVVAEGLGAAAAPLIRRFISEPRLFNRSTGELTEEGMRAARQAGIDPTDLTGSIAQQFARGVARGADPEAAFKSAASRDLGIRRSQGEIAGNREQLFREQQMRGGNHGTTAREQAEQFDRLQREDVVRAVRGVSPPGAQSPSVAEMIAPNRKAQLARTMGVDDIGRNVKNNTDDAFALAKADEQMKWDAVPSLKATPETLQDLDASIANVFAQRGGIMVDDAVTPMAAKMGKELDAFKAGETPTKSAGVLPSSPAGDIQTMRKRLLATRNAAQTPEDQRAAKAIYDSFLEWEVIAAEKTGNLIAAAKSRSARDATRILHDIFDGQKGTPASNMMAQVLRKADTPEGLVNALFSAPTSQGKAGSYTALVKIKEAYDTYLEPAAAKTAWDDLRLAYWLKHTADKGNEVMTPGNLSKAIKSMLGTQPTIVRTLYNPAEIAHFKRMAVALDDIKAKNPNTSWSSVGVGQLMKDFATAAVKMIGWNSPAVQAVAGPVLKPFRSGYGSAQARQTFGNLQGADVPAIAPSWGGYGGALTSTQDN